MKGRDMNMIIYACVTSFIFIYAFPFIFIGYHGHNVDIKTAQLTVLELQHGPEYPLLTNVAIWFAKQKIARLILTILIVGFLLGSELWIPNAIWKQSVYLIIMWINLAIFSASFLGLIALLI